MGTNTKTRQAVGRHRAPSPRRMTAAGLAALTLGGSGVAFAIANQGVANAATGPSATFTSSANPAAPALSSGTWVSASTDNPKGFTSTSATAALGMKAHVFVSSTGAVGQCAQDVKPGPSTSNTLTAPSASYTAQKYVSGAYTGTEGSYTQEGIQELAYILAQPKWSPALSSADAPRAYTADDVSNGILAHDTAEHTLPAADQAGVKALSDAQLAEAEKYHGPYKMTVAADSATAPKVGDTVTVSVTVQTQATGVIVPGQSVQLNASDGYTFEGGATSQTITTGTSATSVKLVATKAGTKPVLSAQAAVAPSGLWLQTNGKTQNIWSIGVKESLGGQLELLAPTAPETTPAPTPSTTTPAPTTTAPSTTPPAPEKKAYTPSLTTVAKQDTGNVWDTGSGKDYPADTQITGHDVAYKVPNGTAITNGQIPASAVKIGDLPWSAKSDATGAVSFETTKLPNPGAGWTVEWVESSDAGQNDTATWPAVTGIFGAPNESTTVETPAPSTSVTPTTPAPTPSTPAPVSTPAPSKPVPAPVIQTG